MKKLGFVVCAVAFLSGCVSNQAVRTVEAADYSLNCEQLQFKLADLGAKFEDAKDDSGLTGKNVGLGLLFWPGIIVNESRSSKNQDSLDDRIVHLTNLYSQKCLTESEK
jgi:outer membrane murein-binding lipoprotein Lpp